MASLREVLRLICFDKKIGSKKDQMSKEEKRGQIISLPNLKSIKIFMHPRDDLNFAVLRTRKENVVFSLQYDKSNSEKTCLPRLDVPTKQRVVA